MTKLGVVLAERCGSYSGVDKKKIDTFMVLVGGDKIVGKR